MITLLAQTVRRNVEHGLAEAALETGLVAHSETTVVARIVNVTLTFVGVILVVLVIYAGYLYLTAAGNEEKVKRAKTLLGGAIIGMLITVSAFAISTFVLDQLSGAFDATPTETPTENQFDGFDPFPDEIPV